MPLINRGFRRKRPLDPALAERLPPGQHLVKDLPVLTVGPTPRPRAEEWTLRIDGAIDMPRRWTWHEFQALPSQRFGTDVHCVTSSSKLGTVWEGVSLDTLLDGVETSARYLRAVCDGGYDTNHALADVTGGKAWIAYAYDDQPLAAEHGGPARLLVPHLYFRKSAKWVRQLILAEDDRLGFWETHGYHRRGHPCARSATTMTGGR
jgi:DMSO/TMAO reductase YedYZ molybdopterin-dependent catalytic subunit